MAVAKKNVFRYNPIVADRFEHFPVYLGVLALTGLLSANLVLGHKRIDETAQASTVKSGFVKLIGTRLNPANWHSRAMLVPCRFLILPHCASCSKTPPDKWPALIGTYPGLIVSPNYSTEWPMNLRDWAKQHSVVFDPDGKLVPNDAFDAGPVDLMVRNDGTIANQSFGWPRGGL